MFLGPQLASGMWLKREETHTCIYIYICTDLYYAPIHPTDKLFQHAAQMRLTVGHGPVSEVDPAAGVKGWGGGARRHRPDSDHAVE